MSWYFTASAGLAGRRAPLGTIRLLLEVRARHEVGVQIPRVSHHRRHGKPLVAGRRREAIEVLGDDCIFTVRHAILPEPAADQVISEDLQVCTRCRSGLSFRTPTAATSASGSSRPIPFRKGETLQGTRGWRGS